MPIQVLGTQTYVNENVVTNFNISNVIPPSGGKDLALVIGITIQYVGASGIGNITWGDAGTEVKLYGKPWSNDTGIEFWIFLESELATSTATMNISMTTWSYKSAVSIFRLSGVKQTTTPHEADYDVGAFTARTMYSNFSSYPNVGFLNLIHSYAGGDGTYVTNTYCDEGDQTHVLNNVWSVDTNNRTSSGYKIATALSETVSARHYNTGRIAGDYSAAYVCLQAASDIQPVWFS